MEPKKKYDSTVARIAGNILSGVRIDTMSVDQRHDHANMAVALARMTPDERQRDWYREMALLFGELSAQWAVVERKDDFAASRARLAAHFGRLALGEEEYEPAPSVADSETSV